MTLVVGLGNPTIKYKNNRHNIGFIVVDSYINNLNPTAINKKKFSGELYKIDDLLFLKPLTYMNNSGLSVKSVYEYFDIDKVIVIHDDLEIPFGSIRIKRGGGNGGHNGLKSIDAHIGNDYERIRVGISKPTHKEYVSDYVLSNFTKKEQECLPLIIEHSCKTLNYLLDHTAQDTALKYTLKKSLCQKKEDKV